MIASKTRSSPYILQNSEEPSKSDPSFWKPSEMPYAKAPAAKPKSMIFACARSAPLAMTLDESELGLRLRLPSYTEFASITVP